MGSASTWPPIVALPTGHYLIALLLLSTNINTRPYSDILTDDCDITVSNCHVIRRLWATFTAYLPQPQPTSLSPPKSQFTMSSAFQSSSTAVSRCHVESLEAHHIVSKVFLVSVSGIRYLTQTKSGRVNTQCSWIMLRQLRWIGHATLLSSQSSFVWAPQHDQRYVRGQNKHFSIHIKDTLKKCHTPPDQLEVLAAD